MDMHNPAHPGAVLREDVLLALHMTTSEAAERLGVPLDTLCGVLGEMDPITADLAVRLEAAGQSTARFWLAMQAQYDLWQARTNAAVADVIPLAG